MVVRSCRVVAPPESEHVFNAAWEHLLPTPYAQQSAIQESSAVPEEADLCDRLNWTRWKEEADSSCGTAMPSDEGAAATPTERHRRWSPSEAGRDACRYML